MAAVANVAVNLDSRGVPAKLKQIQQASSNLDRSFKGLQGSAAQVKSAIEAQQGGFAKASTVQGVFSARVLNTEKAIRAQIAALREVQSSVKFNGALYQKASRQIKQYEEVLRSANKEEERGVGIRQRAASALASVAATAGAGRVAVGITRTAAGFEEELRRAAAIEGGGNLDQLRQSIERVASTAAGTPTEVAALATSLSRAGFTAQETSESLQGIVTGAEATSVAFDQLGSIVSSSLRAFGLATSDTASVVDTLVQTANSSNQTILDLGEALSYAAPGARTLGISIGDLSATIGLLADNGIRQPSWYITINRTESAAACGIRQPRRIV